MSDTLEAVLHGDLYAYVNGTYGNVEAFGVSFDGGKSIMPWELALDAMRETPTLTVADTDLATYPLYDHERGGVEAELALMQGEVEQQPPPFDWLKERIPGKSVAIARDLRFVADFQPGFAHILYEDRWQEKTQLLECEDYLTDTQVNAIIEISTEPQYDLAR